MLLPHSLSTRARSHCRGELAAGCARLLARARALLRPEPVPGVPRLRWPDPELASLGFFLLLIGLTFVL